MVSVTGATGPPRYQGCPKPTFFALTGPSSVERWLKSPSLRPTVTARSSSARVAVGLSLRALRKR